MGYKWLAAPGSERSMGIVIYIKDKWTRNCSEL